MRLLNSADALDKISRKYQIRIGQLCKWKTGGITTEEGFFIIAGFREWDDSESTAVILHGGTIVTDYYLDYIRDASCLIEDSDVYG